MAAPAPTPVIFDYCGSKTYVEFVEKNSGKQKYAKITAAISTPLLVAGGAVVATVTLGSIAAVVVMAATALFSLAAIAALIALVIFKSRASIEEQKLFNAITAKRLIPHPKDDVKDKEEQEAFRKLLKTGSLDQHINAIYELVNKYEKTAPLERMQLLLAKLSREEVTKKYPDGNYLAYDMLQSKELQKFWKGLDANEAGKVTQMFREVIVRGGVKNPLRTCRTDKLVEYEFSLLDDAVLQDLVPAVQVLKEEGATKIRRGLNSPALPMNDAYRELVKPNELQ